MRTPSRTPHTLGGPSSREAAKLGLALVDHTGPAVAGPSRQTDRGRPRGSSALQKCPGASRVGSGRAGPPGPPRARMCGAHGVRALPRRAFTLIETLLSVAVLGMLLLTLNFFVFSMAEIWGAGAERRLFEQHVRAVTREVETLLRQAVLPPLASDPPLFVREIRLDDGRRMSPLTFELGAGSPRLPWPTVPLPDVVCALVQQDGRGLVLYWQSRHEAEFEQAAPRAFVLSPFGAGLTYDYNESDGSVWRSYDQLQRDTSGQWRLPQRVKLRFVHGSMNTETTVTLPPAPGIMPHF